MGRPQMTSTSLTFYQMTFSLLKPSSVEHFHYHPTLAPPLSLQVSPSAERNRNNYWNAAIVCETDLQLLVSPQEGVLALGQDGQQGGQVHAEREGQWLGAAAAAQDSGLETNHLFTPAHVLIKSKPFGDTSPSHPPIQVRVICCYES